LVQPQFISVTYALALCLENAYIGRYVLVANFLKAEMMDWGSLLVVSA
jgi:hypothetical protein